MLLIQLHYEPPTFRKLNLIGANVFKRLPEYIKLMKSFTILALSVILIQASERLVFEGGSCDP